VAFGRSAREEGGNVQRSLVRRFTVGAFGALAAAALFVPAAAASGTVGSHRSDARDARSGAAIMAGAYRQGLIHLSPAAPASPDPTFLGNIRASTIGTQPANETPMTANPANPQQMATAANDYNCANLTGIYTSDDGGATFPHSHCGVAPTGRPNGGDPALGYTSTGRLFAGYLACNSFCSTGGLAYQSSTDNGVTWSAVRMISPAFSLGLSDKPWMEIDNFASSPFKGTIYVSSTEFNSSFNQEQIGVAHSTDGGATWTRTFPSTAQSEPSVDQFSDLAVAKDGAVYVSWMRCSEGPTSGRCANRPATMLVSKSTDGGSTWSPPVTVAMVMLAPGADFYGDVPGTSERLSNIPVIDVDNSSGGHAGSLYAATYTWTGTVTKLQVSTSTNGGTTWSAPVAVFPAQTKNMFFSWLSISRSNGFVGVSYDYGDASTYRTRAALSKNGGVSFVGNANIASASSAYTNDGFGGTFMGDYAGNIWSGNVFHASWTDTRNGANGQAFTGGVSL
jgi:hypothetical protein